MLLMGSPWKSGSSDLSTTTTFSRLANLLAASCSSMTARQAAMSPSDTRTSPPSLVAAVKCRVSSLREGVRRRSSTRWGLRCSMAATRCTKREDWREGGREEGRYSRTFSTTLLSASPRSSLRRGGLQGQGGEGGEGGGEGAGGH